MLNDRKRGEFIPLPNEVNLFTSTLRVGLSLAAPGYVAQPFKLQCKDGVAYLTSSRLVYIPTTPSPELESFSAPIQNILDSHVHTPIFGANIWVCTVRAVSNGGLPSSVSEFDLKLTFKDGGAYDFLSALERAKEDLHLQMEYQEDSIGEDLPSYDGAPGYSAGQHQGPPPPDGPPPGYEEAQMDGVAAGLQNYAPRA